MAVSDAEIKFMLFYIIFIGVIILFSPLMSQSAIDGMTQEQIDIVNAPITNIYDVFGLLERFTIFLEVSTGYQLLAVVLTPTTLIFLYILVRAFIDALPFT